MVGFADADSLYALSGQSIMFVISDDWFFASHFLALGRAARDAGMRVAVCTRVSDAGSNLHNEGFSLIPLAISRDGIHPATEALALWRLRRGYRRHRPTLLHHITPKLVIYGSLAARGMSTAVINTISGLGSAFVDPSGGLVPGVMQRLFRLALRRNRTWTQFENPDDRELFVRLGLVELGATSLIRGAGVDTERFRPGPPEAGPPLVVLPARMLADKGVLEFCRASEILAKRGVDVRMVLLGRSDPGNPSGLPPQQLTRLCDETGVQWWGHTEDMPTALRRAQIVALPSYREGLPKALLEAAATGLPLIATDVPGCREVCLHGVTGLLIEPRSPLALARAIEELVYDPNRRARLGAAARALVQREFAIGRTVRATLSLYANVLRDDPTVPGASP
ncbi:MAG: glycosyltransferase family 4 protein [Myxococcales bacterium FL481]|nr:MAG: glycosyltransferase family 4 protein [Myxococcales bacterium FL481]